MKKALSIALSLAAVGFFLAAGIVFFRENELFQRVLGVLPAGSAIAGVPVGGLTAEQAAAALEALPPAVAVQFSYAGQNITTNLAQLGYRLDSAALIDEARASLSAYSLVDWLFAKNQPPAVTLPARATVDRAQVEAYLRDIAAAYDHPAVSPYPISGSTQYIPGQAGSGLALTAAVDQTVAALQALQSLDQSPRIDLPIEEQPAPSVSQASIGALLREILDQSGYDGLAEIALIDLKTGETLNFAHRGGQDLPPEIAFSAASTIKIPILISSFKRLSEPTPAQALNWMEGMIVRSENPPGDDLMSNYINEVTGPLDVTADMRELGLENTFLAGYFYLGAPLLDIIQTPANTRGDVNTSPDMYNQTTALDSARLMRALYQCAQTQNGPLIESFGGQVSPAECQQALALLEANNIQVLIEGGLPEANRVAHKHGWTEEMDGLLHTISDTAVVYTPGGDYVLTLYLYHPSQLLFDPANRLIGRLSQAVYNAYNLTDQLTWPVATTYP